jgi:hypothetical protein
VVDLNAMRVSVDGVELELTPTEYRLLVTLLERRGRVQSRQQLLESAWDIHARIETRTVDMHVQRLRAKLGEHGWLIETVRGFGYRFRVIAGQAFARALRGVREAALSRARGDVTTPMPAFAVGELAELAAPSSGSPRTSRRARRASPARRRRSPSCWTPSPKASSSWTAAGASSARTRLPDPCLRCPHPPSVYHSRRTSATRGCAVCWSEPRRASRFPRRSWRWKIIA